MKLKPDKADYDCWKQINWFAVQAKPYRETLAATHVAKLDAEVFLPRIKQEQMICGFARIVTKPLFVGYFFARFCPAISLDVVRYAHGVLRVVGSSRFPIPVDDGIIEEIRTRIQDDGYVMVTPQPFSAGDRVAIEEGPFQGFMGRVERESDDGRRVTLLLEAIQEARLSVEKRWLAPAQLA